MAKDLSILIPARNEEFLSRTIEDILEHSEADTEVIVVLDGKWAEPVIKDDPRIVIVYVPESIGQRAATNLACRLSKAKFVMKCDAHCSFDQGFDRKLIEVMQDDYTLIPTMKNLHAFDWVCTCGFRHYQDKGQECPKCKVPMTKEMVWQPRRGTRNYAYCFDSEPHFQYAKWPDGGNLTETMSIQGSCFMMTREKYWELNICDESLGSWGSQGIEVACKTWLSGGKVMCYHDTWYAHMFRTKPENSFGFPYKQNHDQVQSAKMTVKDLFFKNQWDKQIYPLSWLLEKFWPVRGWTDEALNELKKYDTFVANN